jgi:predicted dehydrogenase
MPERDEYALKTTVAAEIEPPVLPYRPPRPRAPGRIALVGAGGISFAHLDAYRAMGWDVAAICSRDRAKARARADEFYPRARVTTDYEEVLAREDIEIVDLTPHPEDRGPLIEAALEAGKHVLSQKPFVTDLDEGLRLCDLADAKGLRLAVNQNGRWSPHMAWMRAAVERGHLGEVMAAHVAVRWDHRWIRGTPFEAMRDVVLYDFGVHWFDFVASLMRRKAVRVQGQTVTVPGAGIAPPMLASAMVDFGDGQATLSFDAAVPFGPLDSTYVAGTKGSLVSRGPDLSRQQVELWTEGGVARPVLEGQWFNDGFAGTMGELMCAVEEDREPANGARGNLESLALAFAAIASAREGRPVAPWEVRRLPDQAIAGL